MGICTGIVANSSPFLEGLFQSLPTLKSPPHICLFKVWHSVDGNQKSGENHHLGCIKPWVNNGINYHPQLLTRRVYRISRCHQRRKLSRCHQKTRQRSRWPRWPAGGKEFCLERKKSGAYHFCNGSMCFFVALFLGGVDGCHLLVVYVMCIWYDVVFCVLGFVLVV